MEKKSIHIIIWLIFFVASAGLVFTATLSKDISVASIMNVKIVQDKDTGIWRVRDNKGRNKGTINVKKKDRIVWQAIGSDLVFTFPKPVNKYFDYEKGLFADSTSQRVSDKEKLRLTVKATAPSDTVVYEVYVVDADTFVVGNSPPKVVIK
ncbi:MAG: hypothetical protein PVH63_07290 [Balneolaceae bacterium]|jgi:hypothetical protein